MLRCGKAARAALAVVVLTYAVARRTDPVFGQESSAQPPSATATRDESSSSPSDPERVRRALARPPAGLLEAATKVERTDGLTFRTSVTEKGFNIWEYWGPRDTAVAPYVQPWFSEWHNEYLRMVTPEYGRRAALYPTGMVPVMPGLSVLTNAIERALQKRAERKAKAEVREALEQFFREHPEARAPAPSPPDKIVP